MMQGEYTQVIQTLQDQVRISAKIQQTLLGGVPIAPPVSYTFAALPATAGTGTMAYCTNGRKPGEGAGAGTGVPVWYNVSGVWFSVCSGLAVTV
jgi:hypothetical protein